MDEGGGAKYRLQGQSRTRYLHRQEPHARRFHLDLLVCALPHRQLILAPGWMGLGGRRKNEEVVEEEEEEKGKKKRGGRVDTKCKRVFG